MMSAPISGATGLRAFYDDPEVVDTYLARRTTQPLNSVLHERQVAFLNQVICLLEPQRVLEVAPGPGRLTSQLREVPLAVGADASPRMLREARKHTRANNRRHWRFTQGDAFRLPFAAATFDLVYSLRFIRHFDGAARARLYRELRRVLRPSGHLVLDAQNRLVALPHRRQRGLHRYPVYDELFLREELEAELKAAGFVPVRVEGIIRRFTWQWRLNRLRRYRLGSLARVIIRALERTADDNPSTWIVLCQATPP